MECPSCGIKRADLRSLRFCPACGTEQPSDPLLGKTIGGRYHVISVLAEGGMSCVYVAEQPMGTSTRRLALKTLLTENARTPQQVARFLEECGTVSQLHHPNTIKFYDYGQTDEGDLWIAMELAEGESLAMILRKEGALAPERVDRLLAQICGSLQEAHDLGIAHRDVKPENLLVGSPAGEEDVVKVIDWGIAKRIEDHGPKLTPLGLVLGSPPYMSPEQFTGSPCDGRSDVYSLGVVAYEALTGQLPFNARELAEWPLLHIREEPAPFDATPRGADVPLNMKRAVMRALAKRPQDRQQSMRELYNELTIGAVRRSSLLASPYEVMAYMPPEPPTQPKPTSAPPPPGVQQAPLPAAGAPAASGPHGTLYAHGPRRPGPTVIDGPPTGEREEVVPMTVREPVPMTMREPKRGRRWPIYIGFGLALASGAAIALVLGLGESPRPKPAPTVTTPLPATQPPPTTAPVPTTPPTATTAAPLPTAPPTTSTPTLPIPESLIPLAPSGPSACRQAIDAANAGFCSLSQRARQRCPEDNPDHQEAHRAWDAKCKK